MPLYRSSHKEKPEEQLARPNQKRIKNQVLTPVVCEDGELCPAPGLDSRYDFCDKTVEWYWQVAHSPQSKLFADTDWISLEETCILHDRIWNPNTRGNLSHTALVNLMSELRRRTQMWGFTHYDRVQLNLTIETEQTKELEERQIDRAAEQFVNYAERLNKKVAQKE